MVADGLTAQQAADHVGYASAAHFTRDFKRQFGWRRGVHAGLCRRSSKITAAAPTTAACAGVMSGRKEQGMKRRKLGPGAPQPD